MDNMYLAKEGTSVAQLPGAADIRNELFRHCSSKLEFSECST